MRLLLINELSPTAPSQAPIQITIKLKNMSIPFFNIIMIITRHNISNLSRVVSIFFFIPKEINIIRKVINSILNIIDEYSFRTKSH